MSLSCGNWYVGAEPWILEKLVVGKRCRQGLYFFLVLGNGK